MESAYSKSIIDNKEMVDKFSFSSYSDLSKLDLFDLSFF